MKLTGILSAYCVCCAVALSAYADADFDKASKLLTAAKNANIQQVQSLISSGADINYVDSTGLSLVCTALMNNDTRAFQILQMYGADASQCDIQIRQYKNRTTVKGSSGVFGGLSNPQTLTLAAGGAALVGGGVALVAGAFNPSNNNGGSSSGGRPGGGGGGGGDSLKPAFTIPYGPAMPDASSESAKYTTNLNEYSDNSAYKPIFEYMNGPNSDSNAKQNYLLMMHGYSPLARGYLGMGTLRYSGGKPLTDFGKYHINDDYAVQGGRPINVALVTANGINAANKPADAGKPTAGINALDDKLVLWSDFKNTTQLYDPDYTNLTNKYYNNEIGFGETAETRVPDAYTQEDAHFVNIFDLSSSGSAVNNASATFDDDLLAKIVGGDLSGFSGNDYIGFMPNGQMSIFRTGNGKGFVLDEDDGGDIKMYSMAGETFATGDTITLFGKTWTLTVSGNSFVAKNGDDEHVGYIGADGLLYINSVIAGPIDTAYDFFAEHSLKQSKTLQDINYRNYTALLNATELTESGKNSKPDVIANLSIVPSLYSVDAKTVSDVVSNPAKFFDYIDSVYVNPLADSEMAGAKPSTDAKKFFENLGTDDSPIVVFSTGAYITGEEDFINPKNVVAKDATFENAVPLIYPDLDHLFMSVVAVGLTGNGTSGATSISGFNPTDKYTLSQWSDGENKYVSRIYGKDMIQDAKSAGIDPWGFAATGVNAEQATAAAAGAVGAVKSAFNYMDNMNNKKIFTLLALTADGPYLGYDDSGNKYTEESLANYLRSKFILPNGYDDSRVSATDYLDTFKTVYGYGLINLERATRPGKSIYYYDPNKKKIVAGNGTAYWRAAVDTSFDLTGPFGARGATISAPFYDVLTSIDGEMSLPRVWENEISLGSDSVHALYMGDVLGDLKTRTDSAQKTKIGNISLSMAISDRPYADNLGGLDNLGFAYENDRFNLSADFQRYFTDGQSRFSGMANPILSLSANTISTGADYKVGNFFVGGRAFSGNITDEAFLQNDPTISSQYQSLSLGVAQGAMSQFGWNNKKLSLVGSVGFMHESNTVLGAQTNGLLGIGNGNTTYFDMLARYDVTDNVSLSLRSTFAQTKTNPTGMFINDVSDLNSNAFAFGANLGNFEFTVSRPLAIRSGALRYAYADYDIIDNGNGKYDLSVSGAGLRDLSLAPDVRETRFSGTYRHSFGEFTDGALGFIYRVNPNNTNQFGNESIFMLKLTHRLGI